jgi:predicted MFS family arabinose efflux permease
MFEGITDAITRFIQKQVDTLREQVIGALRDRRPAIAVTVVGVVLALFALGILLGAAVAGLDLVLPHWAALLIVGGVLAFAAAIVLPRGIRGLRSGSSGRTDE